MNDSNIFYLMDLDDFITLLAMKIEDRLLKMEKETFLRLAQPLATLALALSVATLPLTVRAYDQSIRISGSVEIEGDDSRFHTPININCVSGCISREGSNPYRVR